MGAGKLERNRAPIEGFRCKANRPSCDGHHIALAAAPLLFRPCWSGGGMRHDCGLDRDLCSAVRPLRGGRERRAFERLIVHPAAPTRRDRPRPSFGEGASITAATTRAYTRRMASFRAP